MLCQLSYRGSASTDRRIVAATGREEGRLKVGDPAPDVALVTLDGQPTRLAEHFGTKPTVIVFGSFT